MTEALITNEEAVSLIRAAAYGTLAGFTDEEGQALLDWAVRVRAKAAILDSILAGEVVVDIHGMVDAHSNLLALTKEQADQRRQGEDGV